LKINDAEKEKAKLSAVKHQGNSEAEGIIMG
jgi:hypothetical protein